MHRLSILRGYNQTGPPGDEKSPQNTHIREKPRKPRSLTRLRSTSWKRKRPGAYASGQ